MLVFIGLGVEQTLTLRAIEELEKCDQVFYESYTSPEFTPDSISTMISERAKKRPERLTREVVEDGRKILELSKNSSIALVTTGDPMVATTHQDLRARALKQGIRTKIVHGSSILCSLVGELGLHSYSIGKSVSMTKEPMQHTSYVTIYQNLLRGLHTPLLLEWDELNQFFLTPNLALKGLLDAENDLKFGIISGDTIVLCASEIGNSRGRVSAELVSDAIYKNYGLPPHVLVVPGRLHFTEIESLSVLTYRDSSFFRDNSKDIERISLRMVSKYSEKTRRALQRARNAAQKSKPTKLTLESVFENVEAYTDDALRFLNEGKEELAVLSIGYAEGLLDSLRFSGELEFDW